VAASLPLERAADALHPFVDRLADMLHQRDQRIQRLSNRVRMLEARTIYVESLLKVINLDIAINRLKAMARKMHR